MSSPCQIARVFFAALSLGLPCVLSCTPERPADPTSVGIQTNASRTDANAMDGFARMMGGEWRVTFESGATAVHDWQWGPGKRSMRRTNHTSGAGNDFSATDVLYWHPGRREIALLNVHSDIPGIGRGAGSGTIAIAGEVASGTLELRQPHATRKLAMRWEFTGPDAYHDTLLEDGGSGFQKLVSWDVVRSSSRSAGTGAFAAPSRAPLPSEWTKLEALLGRVWEAQMLRSDGDSAAKPVQTEWTMEWCPRLALLVARVDARNADGETTALLDAYLYRHPQTGAFQVLALSSGGGVFEGEMKVGDAGELLLEASVVEVGREEAYAVRLDLESEDLLRARVWIQTKQERTPSSTPVASTESQRASAVVLDVPSRARRALPSATR